MKRYLLLSLFVASLSFFAISQSGSVSALSGSQFSPGRIMDDSVFFTNDNITANNIQVFLNAKVPNCDTNGTQPYGGTTRAAYGTSKGYPPPYTCLKDYQQNTPSKAAESGLCGAYSGGTKSSAQIIFDIAQSCSINSRVLITLLQKEQTLVTDDWPWSVQYRSATGYGCPDTAACDSTYYGFFNQVYSAARQFKKYARDSDNYSHKANRVNSVRYNPNASCGSSDVLIQNQATAGLYNYTPYQPNQAALNNLYGTGDGCSAYGNRNFWRIFNDWFGSVDGGPYEWKLTSLEAYSDSARTNKFTSKVSAVPGSKIYLRIKALNQGYLPWNKSFMRIGTAHPQDRTSIFEDPSWINNKRPGELSENSVDPSEVGTFDFVLKAPAETGTYNEYFNLVAEGKTWLKDIGLYYTIDVVSPVNASNNQNIQLNSDQKLLPGQYLLSPDSQSVLVLQNDGNLVLYSDFRAVWSSGTNGKKSTELIMQPDGNLVLYDKDHNPLWHSVTYSNPNSMLKIQTDGNLVIYSSSNVALWSTSTVHIPNHLGYVNYRLNKGFLYSGQSLETANRKYRMILQPDGNLVLYKGNKALWASVTAGQPAYKLAMQGDGNLVLYSKSGQALWNSGTSMHGAAFLAMQTDGNLVIYNAARSAIWASNTAGR